MNVKKAFTYYGPGGAPQTGAELILKDCDGIESDVVMTELGNGVYTATVPLGRMWKVYDNSTPPGVDTGFMIEAGYALSREPAIAPGTSTYVMTGNKVWTQLSKDMIIGLNGALNGEEDARIQVGALETADRIQADKLLDERVRSLEQNGWKSNISIGTMTCSKASINIKKTVLNKGTGEAVGMRLLGEFAKNGKVPADGSWIDAAMFLGDYPIDENFGRDTSITGVTPIITTLVPGAISQFGVDIIYNSAPSTAGTPHPRLCDYQFAIAHVKADGTVGPYSEMATPAYEGWAERIPGSNVAPCVHRFVTLLSTPLEVSDPGGYFSIKVRMKLKTPDTAALFVGFWDHANVDIILFPKVA